jgi:hypothetical protein
MSALPLEGEEERFVVFVHLRGGLSTREFKRCFLRFADRRVFRLDERGYGEFRLTQAEITVLKVEGFLYLEARNMCLAHTESSDHPN